MFKALKFFIYILLVKNNRSPITFINSKRIGFNIQELEGEGGFEGGVESEGGVEFERSVEFEGGVEFEGDVESEGEGEFEGDEFITAFSDLKTGIKSSEVECSKTKPLNEEIRDLFKDLKINEYSDIKYARKVDEIFINCLLHIYTLEEALSKVNQGFYSFVLKSFETPPLGIHNVILKILKKSKNRYTKLLSNNKNDLSSEDTTREGLTNLLNSFTYEFLNSMGKKEKNIINDIIKYIDDNNLGINIKLVYTLITDMVESNKDMFIDFMPILPSLLTYMFIHIPNSHSTDILYNSTPKTSKKLSNIMVLVYFCINIIDYKEEKDQILRKKMRLLTKRIFHLLATDFEIKEKYNAFIFRITEMKRGSPYEKPYLALTRFIYFCYISNTDYIELLNKDKKMKKSSSVKKSKVKVSLVDIVINFYELSDFLFTYNY